MTDILIKLAKPIKILAININYHTKFTGTNFETFVFYRGLWFKCIICFFLTCKFKVHRYKIVSFIYKYEQKILKWKKTKHTTLPPTVTASDILRVLGKAKCCCC
jgi:hypothetical protein